jgi:hypothetical protein
MMDTLIINNCRLKKFISFWGIFALAIFAALATYIACGQAAETGAPSA